MPTDPRQPARGFTLLELLVTLAIVALLGTLTVPVLHISVQRAKEQDLRLALREIRSALDAYKAAGEAGEIDTPQGGSGYPPSLEVLAEGVPLREGHGKGKRYFLRRVPRDPMHPDPEVSAATTWGLRSYASEADDPQPGADVYDVYSLSGQRGLNGVAYSAW